MNPSGFYVDPSFLLSKSDFENKRDNYRCVAYPFYLYYTIGEKPQPVRQ